MQTDVKKHKTRNKKQNGLALIFRDTLLTLFLVSNSVLFEKHVFVMCEMSVPACYFGTKNKTAYRHGWLMFRLCFVYCVRVCQGSSLQDAKLAGHLLVCFAQSCLAKQLSEKSEKQFHFVFCVCLAIFDVRLHWALVSGKHVRQCFKKIS